MTLRVLDTGLRQAAAVVKVQPLGAEGEGGLEQAFLEYGERVCRVLHSSVATPYTYGTLVANGIVYGYTTRAFVGGVALSDVCRPLDHQSVLRAGSQIARALDRIHAAGLQHHDLKLENVVVRRAAGNTIDELAQCVVIDLSFRNSVAKEASLSEVTLQYVAPELLSGEPADQRADLYSLGVLLYALLAGQLPFPGDSVGAIIRNQRSRDYKRLSDVCPKADPAFVRVVERLLDPHPQNRFESAQAVIAALAECGAEGAGLETSAPLGGVFVGRDAELRVCMNAVASNRVGLSKACVEVAGPTQSGVTSLLREFQDRAEATGMVVLTATPKGLTGVSLQQQLFEPIRALVRQAASGDGHDIDERTPENTTDLLDDIYVATRGRRIALFVDDWRVCDETELTFLRRLVLQDRGTLGEAARASGRFHVVIGDSGRGELTPAVEALSELVEERVEIPLWTREDLQCLVRSTWPASALGNAHFDRIVAAAGGRPGFAIGVLDELHASLGPISVAEVDEAVSKASQTFGSQLDAEVASLRRDPLGLPVVALAAWGERLARSEWRRVLGGDPDVVTSKFVRGRKVVRVSRPHLTHHLCANLDEDERQAVLAVLLPVVAPMWRSSEVDDLLALLRFLVRVRSFPRRYRWHVHRAFLVLMRSGRFAEVENLAAGFRSVEVDDEPRWLRLFELAARLEAGRMIDEASEPQPGRTACISVHERWIHVRALWRSRHKKRALRLITTTTAELSRSEVAVPSAMLADWALLEAEVGDIGLAIGLRRRILRRYVRATCSRPLVCAGLERLRAVLHRVRQRIHVARGEFGRAITSAQKERRIHSSHGNVFAEAATLNNEAAAHLRSGAAERARAALQECARIREQLDDERGLVVALNNLAFSYSNRGAQSNSASALNRARVIALRNGLTRHANLSTLHLVMAYVSNGHLRDAQRALRRLVDQSAALGDSNMETRALLNCAIVAMDRWHLSFAERILDRVSRLRQDDPNAARGFSATAIHGEIAWRTHQLDSVRRVVQVARSAKEQDTVEGLEALLEAESGAGRARGSVPSRLRGLLIARRRTRVRISSNSLARLLRIADQEVSTRLALEAVATFFALARAEEDTVAVGWGILERPDFREGHDDLQVEIRAHLARILRELGREREAWTVLTDTLQRYRRLERKLIRWDRPEKVLDRLYRQLRRAMGIRRRVAGRARQMRSTVLQAEAYAELAKGGSIGRDRNNYILRLGEAIAFTHDPDELIDRVLSLSLEATGAHRALVVIANGNERRIRRYRLAEGARDEGRNAELSWAVLSKVLSTGTPQIYGDALAAEQLSSHRSIAVLNLRSLACVPLQGSQGVIGALYLDHHGMAGLFGEEDLGVLTLLANVIALTLESAEMRDLAESWEERLAEAHRQVVRGERNRLAGQIASGMAHDLKNILTTIVARSQLMLHRKSGTSDARALKSIEKAAHTAASMIEKLQECSREHVMQRGEAVDLGGLAHEAVELLAPRFAAGTGINVDVDADPGIIMQGVAGELRELFLNLILNACDAMPDGGDLKISVKRLEGAEKATVTVSDTGVGMPEEVRARIFEPFFTTKGNAGTGLGLAVVRSAVVRYAGDLVVDSVQGEGTTFTVTFPVAATDSGAFPKSQMTKESPDR